MSTEAQIDLDWAGMELAESGGAGAATSARGAAAQSSIGGHAGAAYLSDEEILGIEPVGGDAARRDSSGEDGPRNDRAIDGGDDAALLGEGAEVGQQGRQAEARPTGGAGADMPAWMAAAAADPKNSAEARALWTEHQEFRAAFDSPDAARNFVQEARAAAVEARAVAEEARAIKELLPGGVRDIVSLREATQSVERIDAALFSGNARAQADVVAEMARANPAAFRSMFAEAARVMAGLDPHFKSEISDLGLRDQNQNQNHNFKSQISNLKLRNQNQLQNQNQDQNQNENLNQDQKQNQNQNQNLNQNQNRRQDAGATNSDTNHESPFADAQGKPVTNHAFDAAAYAAFERSTNETVARDVRGSITDTLARVMPEGVAEGAARRIGEDIFGEVHRALAGDRALSEQVAAVLRGGAAGSGSAGDATSANGGLRGGARFGAAEQARVAALVAGRAKQLVPSVARRVIGEWTSSVLSTARSKAARQAAAAARVDIAAPGGSADSMPLRAMSAREVNYSSMSDEQILGM